jgi:hypothetical protein
LTAHLQFERLHRTNDSVHPRLKFLVGLVVKISGGDRRDRSDTLLDFDEKPIRDRQEAEASVKGFSILW